MKEIIHFLRELRMHNNREWFALLCIFACRSEDIVSTVEESVKPANEVAIQTVNLLDSLEIMDYIYSIIGPMAKTRSNLPGGGYILPDNWDSQLTDEQRELIRNSFHDLSFLLKGML